MSFALISACNPRGELIFELPLSDVLSQGRAADALRQMGPIGQLRCRFVAVSSQVAAPAERDGCGHHGLGKAGGPDVEQELACVRQCLEAPLVVITAGLALMAEQGFGQIRIATLDPVTTPAATAVNTFWRQWVEEIRRGPLVADITVELRTE